MKLKDIPKITELGNKLSVIKEEILEISKIASLIANGDAISSFELKVVDKTKIQPESKSEQLDDEFHDFLGQAFPGLKIVPLSLGNGGFMPFKPKNKAKENVLSLNLMDSDALLILGNLVARKHLQQAEILEQLKKLGVKEEKSL